MDDSRMTPDWVRCPHLHVRFAPGHTTDGMFVAAWHCEDCQREFIPFTRSAQDGHGLINRVASGLGEASPSQTPTSDHPEPR